METSLINSCPGMVFVGMIRFSRCLRIQARKAFHVFINGRLTVFTQTVYASKCNKRQIQPFWKRYRAWTRWLLGLFPSYLNVVWNDKIYKFYKIILESLFEEINAKEIVAVKDATYAVAKRKPGKNSGLLGFEPWPLQYRCSTVTWCIDTFHELQVKFVLFRFCSHTAHVLWHSSNSLLDLTFHRQGPQF